MARCDSPITHRKKAGRCIETHERGALVPADIEPTISLGNVINILVTMLSVLVAFWRIAARLTKFELKVNMIWNWYKSEHGIKDKQNDDDEN